MKAKTMKTTRNAYLFALTLSVCLALLAVKGDLNQSVSATPVQTREPDGSPQTIDDKFAEVARLAPGFGGMFIQDQTLQVYLLDPAQRAAAEAAIVAVFGRERLPEGEIQILQGRYGFLQLKTWHDRQRANTMAIPGVVMTSIAESRNRLQIGVMDRGVIAQVENELFNLGVPREAVDIVETAPFEDLQSLQSSVRPALAGTQIQRAGGGICTMGFTAVRQGQAGFVTNSHCTATRGVVEGSVYHQATVSGVANRFGVETVDPPYFTNGPFCPSGRQCRFSDSAFISRNGGQNPATLAASASFGYMALPDSNMTIVNKFRVVGEVPFPIGGESLSKVGRTTGMTSGEVSDTCVDVKSFSNGQDTGFTYLCQDVVDTNSNGGDSGSPVFSWSSASLPPNATIPAKLYGVLRGGNGSSFVFSAMVNIECELGQLKTAKEQAGANSPPEVKIVNPTGNIIVGSGGLNIVDFEASVVDYEGCCAEVKWESSIDGLIGTSSIFSHSFSSQGFHTVTVTATDNDGATSSDTMLVTVNNGAPTVWINKPTSMQTLYLGSPYVFEGSSSDPNEISQKLPCGSMKWTSSNAGDPFPKWGCMPQVTFSTTGSRTITLKGTDSDGASDTASVQINVVNPPVNGPPVVTILNPQNKKIFDADEWIMLKGTANDPDNENPLTYEWKLLDGSTWTPLFTGTMNDQATVIKSWKPLNNFPFSCGGSAVRLYLFVTDPDGQTGSAYVDISIFYPVC